MKISFALLITMVFIIVCWIFFSKQQYEFLYPNAYKTSAHCPKEVINTDSECYYIPDLNYKEAMDWHENKLSYLGWKGGATSDDSPITFIYEKEDEKIKLIFYPKINTEGNISTMHYDKEGVGLLIKNI